MLDFFITIIPMNYTNLELATDVCFLFRGYFFSYGFQKVLNAMERGPPALH